MANRLAGLGEPELERMLLDLGSHLAYPPTPHIANAVRRRLLEQPATPKPFGARLLPFQRQVAIALLALIVLVAGVLALSPEARTAVAERLGLRSVQITQLPAQPSPVAQRQPAAAPATQASPSAPAAPVPTPSPSELGSRLSLGQRTTLDDARSRVPFAIELPAALGPPDAVYVLETPPGGQVALVYAPRPDLPQASTTGVGLLVTEFQGSFRLGKGLPEGTRLEELTVDGAHRYWLEGDPHVLFYLDARGQARNETTRLAGNVLAWDQGAVTFRIESALSKDAALAIATSMR
jgi:hypothetical protein